MATLAFLPALPAGTLGSRNACVGGDGFTSRGECQGLSWFLCTLSEGVTIPSEMSLMLASASSAVRKKNCAFSFSTRENLL